jgi:hypothetical protein
MIVPIWRSWFLFRFKGERTAPESLMGTDSGFVLARAICALSLIFFCIRHIPAQARIQLNNKFAVQSWFPACAGMTAEQEC